MSNIRMYAQYADKPKTVEWLNITPSMADSLFNASDNVRMSYYIDTAVGAQLDVIGRVVVIDRSYESQIVFTPDARFGATRFGGLSARFNNRGETVSNEVSDAIYRVLIRAKIAKNNSDATLDGIVKSLSYITNSNPITVVDNEDMTFSVSFGTELTSIERFVFDTFDVVPRPQGVRFLGYTETKSILRFGSGINFGDDRARFNSSLFGA